MTLENLPVPFLRQQGHGATHVLLNPLVNDLRDRMTVAEAAVDAIEAVDTLPHMASVAAAVFEGAT